MGHVESREEIILRKVYVILGKIVVGFVQEATKGSTARYPKADISSQFTLV